MARQPIQPPGRAGRAGRTEWVDTQALFRNAGAATSYEIQFFRDQRWRIDSMFDDGALALHEAKRMSDSGRYVSVRVIEESFDPVTGEERHATIFRGGRVPEANRKELQDSLKMRREIQSYQIDADEQEERLQNRAGRGDRTRDSEAYRLPILGICVSVILVLGTLVALHYLRP